MRISDWSSDVCSSDLDILAIEQDDRCSDQVERGCAHLLVFGAPVTKPPETMECDSARQGVAGFPLVQFRSDQSTQIRIFEPSQGEQRSFDPADLPHGHSEAVLLAIGRSEAHTSELQSLMRISYAVFCLQKKNTT